MQQAIIYTPLPEERRAMFVKRVGYLAATNGVPSMLRDLLPQRRQYVDEWIYKHQLKDAHTFEEVDRILRYHPDPIIESVFYIGREDMLDFCRVIAKHIFQKILHDLPEFVPDKFYDIKHPSNITASQLRAQKQPTIHSHEDMYNVICTFLLDNALNKFKFPELNRIDNFVRVSLGVSSHAYLTNIDVQDILFFHQRGNVEKSYVLNGHGLTLYDMIFIIPPKINVYFNSLKGVIGRSDPTLFESALYTKGNRVKGGKTYKVSWKDARHYSAGMVLPNLVFTKALTFPFYMWQKWEYAGIIPVSQCYRSKYMMTYLHANKEGPEYLWFDESEQLHMTNSHVLFDIVQKSGYDFFLELCRTEGEEQAEFQTRFEASMEKINQAYYRLIHARGGSPRRPSFSENVERRQWKHYNIHEIADLFLELGVEEEFAKELKQKVHMSFAEFEQLCTDILSKAPPITPWWTRIQRMFTSTR